MKVIYGLKNIGTFKNPSVALGVFDGVHRGHRAIISRAVKKAQVTGGESVVVTFWPHPGDKESLYSLQHRLRLLQEMGVGVCVVIRFSKSFSRMSAPDFIRKLVSAKLGTRFLFVGKNFRFGRGARGSVRTLRSLAAECGYTLQVCPVTLAGGTPISSTRIRRYIRCGNLRMAEQLLGRPVGIFGTVVHGAALGRAWGIPTANIRAHHEIIPPQGIYAVRVYVGTKQHKGVCYIGPPPRFIKKKHRRSFNQNIEVHILNFAAVIYDRNIEIHFLRKLRERIEFPNPSDLIKQIKKDIKSAAHLR